MTFLYVRRRKKVLFRLTPGPLPSGATFARSTTATYKDAGNVRQTAAINTLRSGHFIGGVQTILLEGASTNHFLNSGTPATQTSPSLGTGTYTLWMEGTGSIAVAGTTATITGAGTATNGVPVTFVVTVAGTVTYTVTGSPTLAQAENLPFASSYIPTTGASVTRGADSLWLPFTPNPQALTVYQKHIDLGSRYINTARHFNIGAQVGERLTAMNAGAGGTYRVSKNSTSSTGIAPVNLNDVAEIRAVLNADGSATQGVTLNAGAEQPDSLIAAVPLGATFSAQRIYVGVDGDGVGGAGFIAVQSLKVAAGVQSLATMRGL